MIKIMTILQRITILEKTRNSLVKKSKNVTLWMHASVVFLGVLASSVIYLLIVKSLNLNFENPPTTTISWFTVNNYPRQQEYFYFFTCFIFITLFTWITWFLFIWLKKSK